MSESWSDGAGRVRRSRTEHPDSSGGWSGSIVEYDILGQVKRSSVPTEISVPNANNPDTWAPAGDDYTRGWLWTYQKYDWKGRVVRKINTDGVDSPTLNNSDILITYEGCGCAGGQVTTVKGPVTTAVDVAGQTQTTKRRTQKAYEDILGRTYKTEIYDLDGVGSPYSTVKTTFNGRDQATLVREFAGSEYSTTYQETKATFDGHGRLSTKHIPQQDANKSTSYNYNADDSISTVTDARGAVTNYTFGNSYAAERRALLMAISYTVPSGSGISDPPDVTFNYDNAGNRTQMNDALGTVNYGYDELSRMTSESRAYNTSDTGFPNNAVTLSYTYTLSGQLKSYATPFSGNLQVNYGFDKVGRLNAVTGTSSSGNTNYTSNPHYRAWGALSHLDYGNGTEMNAGGFNNRLQATTFEVKKGTTQIINKAYEFDGDGSVKKETDSLDARFDRSYSYDFGSRMTKALTGAEARGGTDGTANLPYHNTYTYDEFNHRTGTNVQNFSQSPLSLSTPYTNNRINSGDYDWDGNELGNPTNAKSFEYNAASRIDHTTIILVGGDNSSIQEESITHDGDGGVGKVVTSEQYNQETPVVNTTYRVRSTPLGQIVYEGGTVYVLAGGTRIATNGYWNHQDAGGHTLRSTDSSGNVFGDGSYGNDIDKLELDPDGQHTGFSTPVYYPLEANDIFAPMSNFGLMSHGQYTSHTVDGINVPADFLAMRLGGNRSGDLGMQLLFFSASMSRRVTIFDPMGIRPLSEPMDPDDVPWDEAFRHEWQVLPSYSNWSAINLLEPQDDLVRVELPKDFKTLVRERLKTGDCASFVNDMLKQVTKDYNAWLIEHGMNGNYVPDINDASELLDNVAFELNNNTMAGNIPAGGTVRGSIKGDDAVAEIQSRYRDMKH